MTTPQSSDLTWMSLAIPGARNLRDLGGLQNPDGARIRPGLLLRAELLVDRPESPFYAVLRDDNAAAYRALGVSTVIDLRSDLELEKKPSAWPTATGARMLHLGIQEGAEGTDTPILGEIRRGTRQRFDDVDLAEFYCGILDRRADVLASVVHELATPGTLPALLHCAAGKDRTGMVVANVLELLGFPRETVIAEFVLTGVLVPDKVDAYAEDIRASGVDPQAVRTLFETPPWSITMALEYRDRTYGDAATYLVERGGLGPADIPALRTALLET